VLGFLLFEHMQQIKSPRVSGSVTQVAVVRAGEAADADARKAGKVRASELG
jgi:hypothetical protein